MFLHSKKYLFFLKSQSSKLKAFAYAYTHALHG